MDAFCFHNLLRHYAAASWAQGQHIQMTTFLDFVKTYATPGRALDQNPRRNSLVLQLKSSFFTTLATLSLAPLLSRLGRGLRARIWGGLGKGNIEWSHSVIRRNQLCQNRTLAWTANSLASFAYRCWASFRPAFAHRFRRRFFDRARADSGAVFGADCWANLGLSYVEKWTVLGLTLGWASFRADFFDLIF